MVPLKYLIILLPHSLTFNLSATSIQMFLHSVRVDVSIFQSLHMCPPRLPPTHFAFRLFYSTLFYSRSPSPMHVFTYQSHFSFSILTRKLILSLPPIFCQWLDLHNTPISSDHSILSSWYAYPSSLSNILVIRDGVAVAGFERMAALKSEIGITPRIP